MAWYLPQLKASIESLLGDDYPVTTDIPPDKLAWVAIPVFGPSRKLGLPVSEHASEIAQRLKSLPEVAIEVEGGFVNVRPTAGAQLGVLAESQRDSYGESALGVGRVVVVEFSGVNIAKPMGVGHLRSTIIGDALQRIFRANGYTVHAVNHLGDWGTQFGNLVAQYQRTYGDLAVRKELTVEDLLAMYIDFHTKVEQDEELKAEGQGMFRRLESGDPEVRALWQHFVDLSITQFEAMYQRLDIVFDDVRAGESRYQPFVSALIDQAEQSGVATESQGALIVPLPDESAPLILRKSDGSTIYATRDLAAISYRVREYQPDEILYVVANEQALHFRQVFAAARLLKLLPDTTILRHVKFGLVRTSEGKMSTRKGTVVGLETLLDEAVNRATALFAERAQELSEQERRQTIETLAIGALKYFDLSHDRNHDIVFDWERMLSVKGDSAPYLQYSYVRATNILEKAGTGQQAAELESPEAVVAIEEYHQMLRSLANFPLVLEQSAAQAAPHVLAQYLNNLAAQFHSFYERYPVLTSVGAERAIRLSVVRSVGLVLRKGLALLGIRVVAWM